MTFLGGGVKIGDRKGRNAEERGQGGEKYIKKGISQDSIFTLSPPPPFHFWLKNRCIAKNPSKLGTQVLVNARHMKINRGKWQITVPSRISPVLLPIHQYLQCLPHMYLVELLLYSYNFGPEKGALDVALLWLVLYVVALPISDGPQPLYQGLCQVDQVILPLKSCSKSDFTYKFAESYFQA